MKTAVRIILCVFTFLAFYFFSYWFSFVLFHRNVRIPYLQNVIAFVIAIVASMFVWERTGNVTQGLASYIILGGVITGAIGFILGFVGPIIFTPSNNLGPLLGIFITGPLGFIFGLIGGGIYWRTKQERERVNKS
jgi:hypothetical protein